VNKWLFRSLAVLIKEDEEFGVDLRRDITSFMKLSKGNEGYTFDSLHNIYLTDY